MDNSKEIVTNSLPKIVQHVFGADSADCTFQFINETTKETKQYSAHRKVLSAISSVFATMFSQNWNKNAAPIVIKDATYDSFVAFMTYFYESTMTISTDNVAEILYLADEYDVPELANSCKSFLIEHLCINNVFDYHSMAMRFMCDDLKIKCHQLFSEKFVEILRSNTFTQCELPTLVDFLRTMPKVVQGEEVFDAFDAGGRKNNAKKKGSIESSMAKNKRVYRTVWVIAAVRKR